MSRGSRGRNGLFVEDKKVRRSEEPKEAANLVSGRTGYWVHFKYWRKADDMVSKALARFARISPRKARVIANLVRGRHAGEALQLLEFTKKSAAPMFKKLIESAVANAKSGDSGVDLDGLYVETVFVDKAPNKFMRRWRPRAMGRATRVQKGLSHITLILGER